MITPSFDTWTTIFLFAAIQGIFVALVLMFIKKENKLNNAIIALILLLFSITLVEYVLYWTKFQIYFPHSISISAAFPFLTGVLLYWYFRKIFNNVGITRKDLIHLLPFACYLIFLLPIYLSSADVKYQWLLGNQIRPSLFVWPEAVRNLRWVWPWITILHMSLYAVLIFYSFNKLSAANREVSSWFRWLTGLFLLYIASYTSYYILVDFDFFNSQWDYMISFSMMFFIYFIAWFGYLQPKVFNGFTLSESLVAPQRYKNSALNNEMSKEIAGKLQSLMKDEKLYHDSELRLEKLAEKLNVSRHSLSQVINEQLGMSFFEYLNHLRIEEACYLLTNTTRKELNISEIVFSVGFNNKVSFNNTFKKVTGKTPSEFRKEAFNEAEIKI